MELRLTPRRGGRWAAALGSLLVLAAPAFAGEARRTQGLGFHLFGSDSNGAPLRDRLFAPEEAELGNCDDAKKPAGFSDEEAALLKPAERVRFSKDDTIRLVDIKDPDIWGRAKFGCIVKQALGMQKDPWRKAGKNRLDFVFLFNGGLNTQKNVTDLARRSFRRILADRAYPVFMVWPTGGIDAYGESLLKVRSADRIEPNPLNLVTALTQFASDGLRGVAGLPKTLENGVRYNVDLREHESVADVTPHSRVGKDGVVRPGKNVSHSANIDDPRDAVVLPPPTAVARPGTMALSDMGLSAWNNMVRRTRTAIHSAAEFPPKIPHRYGTHDFDQSCDRTFQGKVEPSFNLRTCYPSGAGAFARFFHWYLACVDPRSVPTNSDGCPLASLPDDDRTLLRNARFTFVGHSMGSIVINELIASYPALPYENIVFMAGADSVRSTRKTLAPLLVRNGGCTRFYNLMLHPKNDAEETTALGLLPKGSLLEYIDHYLDPAKTIDDRTIGKWVNVRATRHMFSPAAQKWSLHQVYDRTMRAVRGEPLPSKDNAGTPVTHGGFNDAGVPFWSERFWNPQRTRFEAEPEKLACGKLFFTMGR